MDYFKSKAAILVEQNKELVISDIDIPNELEVGQVLVKIMYSGICGTQIFEIYKNKNKDKYLPHLLGHEGSGIVKAIGPGVRNVAVGDKVVMHWVKGNGIESSTPNYLWNNKKLNSGNITTFSNYSIVSENRVTKIPDSFNASACELDISMCHMDAAALLGCAVTTGLGAAINDANIKPGDSVLVFGAGGVGLNIVQGAKLLSAYPICATDISYDKLEIASFMGATYVITTNFCDKTYINNTFPDGIDFVFDTTGNKSIIENAYNLLKPSGKLILTSVTNPTDCININMTPFNKSRQIIGVNGGQTNPSVDIPKYLNLYKNKILKLDELIGEICELEDINIYINKIKNNQINGRVLIEMDHDD